MRDDKFVIRPKHLNMAAIKRCNLTFMCANPNAMSTFDASNTSNGTFTDPSPAQLIYYLFETPIRRQFINRINVWLAAACLPVIFWSNVAHINRRNHFTRNLCTFRLPFDLFRTVRARQTAFKVIVRSRENGFYWCTGTAEQEHFKFIKK